MSEALYPLAIEPRERELIWGGHALVTRYGKHAAADKNIGESWECYDGNAVRNGHFAGSTIGELRARLGRELTGRTDPSAIFPLLTKLIDARSALSVQVHPDDAYARRVEGQPNGKAECWHVLESEPGAEIVLGWNRSTTREEYRERVRTGSLDELLRRIPVKAGDSFHLPAGTMHAIGAGIVLFEVQQTSDLTYRIYDYDRPGPDGKLRELHVEKAADVLDFSQSHAGAIAPLAYELDGLRRTLLIAEPHFIVESVNLETERRGIDLDGMPVVVQALCAPVELEARGELIRLEPYQSAVVPAALDVVMVRGFAVDNDGDPEASVLVASPPADRNAIERRLGRAGISDARAAEFLAQF
ncbi:MAG: class I mannose-6-phosphate isomerase [Candidatus Eremiobacteraeota bacterium]|nr:class I mannose-6-phosphate isomerase [Candidatus Eremiobacteraeota bacterium]